MTAGSSARHDVESVISTDTHQAESIAVRAVMDPAPHIKITGIFFNSSDAAF